MHDNKTTYTPKTCSSGRYGHKCRFMLLVVGFMCAFSLIGIKLVETALAQRHIYKFFAQKTTEKRADIVDRNGHLLATNLVVASLYANPSMVKNPASLAKKIKKILPDKNEKKLAKRLATDKKFIWIKRHLSPDEQYEINKLGIPALQFTPENKRVYPQKNLFSHIIGYTNIDNKGLSGIEKFLDKELKGQEQVQLSVDLSVQHIMHEELKKGMDEFSAIGGAGVVMDAQTGEVIAMVSLPDFDPHNPSAFPQKARFNKASLGVYEMGSTFKTFTMAMGFDAEIVTMKDGYDATNPIKKANYTIRDFHAKKRWLSVPEIFMYSSNIGAAKMAMDLGMDRQQEYLANLGMFDSVPIELPERGMPLFPENWAEIHTITVSYGHGIAVTPLHMVRAIGAVVSDGEMKPITLLRKDKAEYKERVISSKASYNVRKLMRMVVEQGTGKNAGVLGYKVGGKTGSAEKPSSSGSYSEKAMVTSFVAAFPMDKPKYVVLVMLDEPKGTKQTFGYATGGWTAAPIVQKVISRMGSVLGIQPEYTKEEVEQIMVNKPKRRVMGML